MALPGCLDGADKSKLAFGKSRQFFFAVKGERFLGVCCRGDLLSRDGSLEAKCS